MKKNISISAFFPFLNDWGSIGSLVLSTIVTLEKITDDYEVIIIDDGSNQMAKDMLEKLENKFHKVKVIHHAQNNGYGGSIKSGINNSTKDLIFYTDGDAQYDPRELKLLADKMNDSIDIVNGYKIKREDPWYRILIGKMYNISVKTLFNVKLHDVDCDFRLMRRKIFDKVKLESNSGTICIEMIKKIQDNGFVFAEVPVHHYWRSSGKSQFFNFSRVARVGFDIVRLWYKLVIKKEHLKNEQAVRQIK